MRIIFSRKGFDSSFGGCPSPLLDGRPLSLPIPVKGRSSTCFGELSGPVPAMVADLTRGRLSADHPCHLDPDLSALSLPHRAPGWRGAFGQIAQSQKHLENRGVGAGDVFVFWGLFRSVERRLGVWRYVGPTIQAAFGWLQIAQVIRHPGGGRVAGHPWLDSHPHAQEGWGPDNTIYIAEERLDAVRSSAPGYGTFDRAYRFTASEAPSPSLWRVPAWLHPLSGGTGMTYHPPARWLEGGALRAAPRGQEFVADVGTRPDALAWLSSLIEEHR